MPMRATHTGRLMKRQRPWCTSTTRSQAPGTGTSRAKVSRKAWKTSVSLCGDEHSDKLAVRRIDRQPRSAGHARRETPSWVASRVFINPGNENSGRFMESPAPPGRHPRLHQKGPPHLGTQGLDPPPSAARGIARVLESADWPLRPPTNAGKPTLLSSTADEMDGVSSCPSSTAAPAKFSATPRTSPAPRPNRRVRLGRCLALSASAPCATSLPPRFCATTMA